MISGEYLNFYNSLKGIIPEKRMFHDALSTLAFGTDASLYRLIPKLVIRAINETEIRAILDAANKLKISVTFRGAGTSLSGQAVTDSVLVITSHGWTDHSILNNGLQIRLQPGIRGAMANRYLASFGRKIGPDPASIDSAMIGGIVANNASGMCCGTTENSYKTIAEIRIVLSDGTVLDTSDKASVDAFKKSHGEILKRLEGISAKIDANEELRERIKRKYKIKNTTGYSLNAFVDYHEGIDILKHIVVGSEGTLAFVSDVTYNTVVEDKFKALAMITYSDIKSACEAVQILKEENKVSAVELIDRAGVRSVEDAPGIPSFLKNIGDESCIILVEARADNESDLRIKMDQITLSLAPVPTELPFEFTTDKKEQATMWKIRKEVFPAIAGMRKSGTTSIIEDVCFPITKLAEATVNLRKVFAEDGYEDAVIYGHALAGNLHFVFNQNFSSNAEVEKYRKFMDDIVTLVVDKYDGSLKAEHGTGRNMAPFVEIEWGKQAYELMKEVKEILDPDNLLNPGVILNTDKQIHLKNLKPCPTTRKVVDKCMECGFCESHCVAEGFTLSPRQRIAAFREIERLKATGEEPHRAAEMQKLFKYAGEQTCATDSLCNLACPLKADAGKLTKEIRHESHSQKAEEFAVKLASNIDKVTAALRGTLKFVHAFRMVFGKHIFGAIAKGMRVITFKALPLWNEYLPTGARKFKPAPAQNDGGKPEVVYFPSCLSRSMGPSYSYRKEKELTMVTAQLLEAAGYSVIYPKNMDKLCCGMMFSSKGYVKAGQIASQALEDALMEASRGGEIPVLCDTTPCLYTMKVNMENTPLQLYEPAEFIAKFMLDKLPLKKLDTKAAIYAVCSSKKMSVDPYLVKVAEACVKEFTVIDSNCDGFAGDRGFFFPELNAHGLRNAKSQVSDCKDGYAVSRTCEIGLSVHTGLTFKSVVYLVAAAAGLDTRK